MATLRLDMKAQRALLLAGSLWEIARFFLVISLLALLLNTSGVTASWLIPWLLLLGSGNLLVAVGAIMLAVFPAKYQSILGLLRLGKALGIFSFLLLLVTDAVRPSQNLEILGFRRVAITGMAAMMGILVLDVLFLAVLILWRGASAGDEAPRQC